MFPSLSSGLVRKAVVTLPAADDMDGGSSMATPASCSLRSWTQAKQPASGRRRARQLLGHEGRYCVSHRGHCRRKPG
ncbi:hypothetical protein CGRA01v4_10245 [Colletotrichum graminicola]|nr:hypothetical protein CGRA01v4_10245 [Colletotrichum graminicola]